MVQPLLRTALKALEDKKATDLVVLDIGRVAAFTDFFVICTGTSSRQMQAAADEVVERLRKRKAEPLHVEGYAQGEWILMDYVDFIIHIFSREKREFYELERLWAHGRQLNPRTLRPRKEPRRKKA
ncbi:MAG: ribosome silencing factor [Acidobacteria bacterium]|nr:ribosome silencing factor [Acidobacteriota bacterium]